MLKTSVLYKDHQMWGRIITVTQCKLALKL